MFSNRTYKAVSQEGDSDIETDNETTFFSTKNGSKQWRIGMRPDDLNQDLALDLPYVHPTLPVNTKKVNYKSRYTRRQLVSGACLLFLIIGIVAAFAVTIIFGEKYMVDDVNPTNSVIADLQSTTSQPSFLFTNESGTPDSPQSGTSVTQPSGDADITTVPVASLTATNGGLESPQDDVNSVTMPTDTPSRPVTDLVPKNRPTLQDPPTTNSLSITKMTITTTTESLNFMSSGSRSSTSAIHNPVVDPSDGIAHSMKTNAVKKVKTST